MSLDTLTIQANRIIIEKIDEIKKLNQEIYRLEAKLRKIKEIIEK